MAMSPLSAGTACPGLEARLKLAAFHCERRDYAGAAGLCHELLRSSPNDATALLMLAEIAIRQAEPDRAVALATLATRSRPGDAVAHFTLGRAGHLTGDLASAAASYRQAIQLSPSFGLAYANLAMVLVDGQAYDAAVIACRQAICCQPQLAGAHFTLGRALLKLGQAQAAEPALRQAIELDADQADAFNALGKTLSLLGRPEEAIACHRRALVLEPGESRGWAGIGRARTLQGRLGDALAAYQTAALSAPEQAGGHFAVAVTRLALGEFEAGWAGYEWRRRLPVYNDTCPDPSKPEWQGEDLAGTTILLKAEQGFGDTLQFIRYVPLVAARGGRILLLVQPALTRLLARLPHVQQVLGYGDAVPEQDVHCPLMSLPHRFGTRLDTIPPMRPPLRPPPGEQAGMESRLGHSRRWRIGLVWAGNPEHLNDHDRSAPLAALAPLLALDGVQWISLQKDIPARDAATLAAHPEIFQIGDVLTDFAATAGAITALDLVVSVDTAVAHLCGAMGKPVWILLPFSPEWRWCGSHRRSAWYPTARLFRQPRPGDWTASAVAVRHAFLRRFAMNPIPPARHFQRGHNERHLSGKTATA
jgi:tetratricopeptide (TPR) repeat protein